MSYAMLDALSAPTRQMPRVAREHEVSRTAGSRRIVFSELPDHRHTDVS